MIRLRLGNNKGLGSRIDGVWMKHLAGSGWRETKLPTLPHDSLRTPVHPPPYWLSRPGQALFQWPPTISSRVKRFESHLFNPTSHLFSRFDDAYTNSMNKNLYEMLVGPTINRSCPTRNISPTRNEKVKKELYEKGIRWYVYGLNKRSHDPELVVEYKILPPSLVIRS